MTTVVLLLGSVFGLLLCLWFYLNQGESNTTEDVAESNRNSKQYSKQSPYYFKPGWPYYFYGQKPNWNRGVKFLFHDGSNVYDGNGRPVNNDHEKYTGHDRDYQKLS